MENQTKCPRCLKDIEESFLFCPYCGEPVSALAAQLKERQDAVAQLKMLTFLLKKVQDEQTLALLERLIEKYRKHV